jgi:hypothetical protein
MIKISIEDGNDYDNYVVVVDDDDLCAHTYLHI